MKRFIIVLFLVFGFVSAGAQEVRDTVVVTDEWRYEGNWPEGQGVLYDFDRGIYIGTFREGKPEGSCCYVSLNMQTRYNGEFKNGKRDGYGVLARPAGFWYEGEFSEGYPHGEGVLFYPDNFCFKGIVHLGKPAEGTNHYIASRSEYESMLPVSGGPELTKQQVKWLKKQKKELFKKKKDNQVPKSDFEHAKFAGESYQTFAKWTNKRLVYPIDAYAARIEGTVVVQFLITEDGELADPRVVRSSGNPSLDCEAFRVVCQSPLWTPGTKDGENITVKYTFPITFRL